MIGWMPTTATRKPFHTPSAVAARAPRRCAPSTPATLFWFDEIADQDARDRARDRHDRADRQVDAAGGDHQRHAERDQHQRGAVAEDVDRGCRRGGRPACGARRRRAPKNRSTSSRAARAMSGQTEATEPGAHARAPRPRSCRRACRASASASFVDLATTAGRAAPRPGRASRSTSSSSAEMNSTDMPSSQSDSTSRWISALAPTSMPRVGSSRISSRGSVSEPAGEQHLLLVAAGQVADDGVRVGGADVERLDVLGDQLVLPPAGDRPRPAAAGLQREHDVLAHRQVADDALGAAVLGAEGDAAGRSSSAGCEATPARRRCRAAPSRPGRRRRAAARARCGPSRAGRRGRRPRPGGSRGRTARSRACASPPSPRAPEPRWPARDVPDPDAVRAPRATRAPGRSSS